MRLDHLSFRQLYGLQHQCNVARFIRKGREKAKAICQSAEVRNAMIRAARRLHFGESREFPPLCYAVVYQRELSAARHEVNKYMACKAGLIREHCEFSGLKFHSFRVFDSHDPFKHRIEIWVHGYPLVCRAMRYRLGLPKPLVRRICERLGCDPAVFYPHFGQLPEAGSLNPANTFPATPDSDSTWKTFCEYAN